MHKIKIIHIAQAAEGVERYLVSLLTEMKKYDKFEHILVCSDLYDQEKFKGIVSHIECVSTMHNPINLKSDLASIRIIRKIIKKYKPNIVYCHSSKAGAIGRIADMGIKNKLIYNAHGWSFDMKGVSNKKIKLYEVVEKVLAPMADTIVCISEYEKKSALEHSICKEEKLKVIYNGINFNEYKEQNQKSKADLEIKEDAFVIGMVGRLVRQKSPDVFVKMAEIVKKRISNAFFIMVGDGVEREVTEEQIKLAGLESCFLITGWVNDPLDYIQSFDVAILLSRWEGFGLVLAEYMLAEKPIIATNIEAIPEVLGNAGFLVEGEDYKKTAELIISMYEDKELTSQIIENGQKRVKKFDVRRTASEHAKLFQ